MLPLSDGVPARRFPVVTAGHVPPRLGGRTASIIGLVPGISAIALLAFALHGKGPLTRCKTGARPVD